MPAMSYLQKHPKTGVYRVRHPIPQAARGAFGGKSEFLQSLGTKDLNEAKRRGKSVIAQIQERIDRAKTGSVFWETHDLDHYVAQWAEASGLTGRAWNNQYCFESRDEFEDDLRSFVRRHLPGLGERDYDDLRKHIENETANLLAPNSHRSQGSSSGRHGAHSKRKRVRLSELRDHLVEAGGYRPRTVRDVRNAFEYLIELHGDRYADEITNAEIRELRDVLLNYPVSGRTPAVKRLGLREAAAREWSRTVSPITVEKLLGFIGKGFRVAVSEGWCLRNPRDGILLPKKTPKSVAIKRAEYRAGQLRQLFGSPLFTGCLSDRRVQQRGVHRVRDYRYWLPWIALYTGARLSEMCQLEATNLRREDGVWFFEFTTVADAPELADSKFLKTEGSKRNVPVHQRLIQIGLLEFAADRRKHALLFESRYPSTEILSREYSKWFGRYLDGIGLKDPALTFHSFRHNFKTACRMASIPEEVQDSITGHVPQNVGGRYGEQKRLLAFLKEQVDRVRYEGMD